MSHCSRTPLRWHSRAAHTRSARLAWFLLSVTVAAGFVLAPAAHADVRPPIRVRLEQPALQPQAGQPYHNVLIISSLQAGQISNLNVESEAWDVASIDAPVTKQLNLQDELRVPFTAVPRDTNEPLAISMDLDGWHFETHIDLSAHAFELAKGPLPVAVVPEGNGVPFPGIDQSMARPDPLPPPPSDKPTEADHAREEMEKNGGGDTGGPRPEARNIRVHGRWVYTRSDGTVVGGDGVAVRVYDDDSPFGSELLATVATDAQGWYDVTFFWNPCAIFCDSEPDLYIVFETGNSKAEVTNTGGTRYSWGTGVVSDYTGTDRDFGWLQPGNPADMPAVHIITDLTRTWRWLTNRGYNNPSVRGVWPDGASGAYYNGDQIHVGIDRQWREDTHSHEYGHHHVGHWATQVTPDYCNGICDSPSGCGHCIWCRETDHDAYSEGWPNWLADVLTRSYAGDYGIASMNFRSQESLDTCGGTLDDPLRTEGFLGAVVRDIEDNTQDDHPEFASGIDRLALGTDEILTVVDLDAPTTPMGFLNSFKARFPWSAEDLWQTAKNCGYEIDTANPGVVTGLTSSHTVSVSSPDPTVDFYWNRASDDCSGTQGYSIVIAGGFVFPDASMDIGNVTHYVTGLLAPGTYYFNIRAVDFAGRWSGSYAAYGPVIIRAAFPANVTAFSAGGWAHPLVPRELSNTTISSCPAPVTLPGEANATYLNVFGINNGESPTPSGFSGGLFIDNAFQRWVSWGAIGNGAAMYAPNWGTDYVRGGRHTYGWFWDVFDEIAETNEGDNAWARQWVWNPYLLTYGAVALRSAPPGRYDGTSWIVDGSPIYENSDGLRANYALWWTVVSGFAADYNEDYDLRLYNASAGASDGFASTIAGSGRLAGCLDAVITNFNTVAFAAKDVGVVNWSGGSSNSRMVQSSNGYLSFGDSVAVSFAQDEYIKLWECYLPPGNVGPVSVTVDLTDPSQGPVYTEFLDRTFTYGGLFNAMAYGTTDASTGRARMDMNLASSGYYCLVVYRDPKDGSAPLTATIEEDTTPPDYMPYQPGGWYASLVPRPAFDGTPGSVPLPTVLYGDIASTYFNVGFQNNSPTGHSFLHSLIYFDGGAGWYFDSWPYPAHAAYGFNWNAAWTLPGGRHTFGMHLDPDNSVEEIYETNNTNGQQWVWQPSTLGYAGTVVRAAPTDPYAGWTDVTTGETFWPNCDGLRTSNAGAGFWSAVAVMPGTSSDVDLRFHERAPDAKNGFDNVLAYSAWGQAASDYVLANWNLTGFRQLDAGMIRYAGGENYAAELVAAPYLGVAPQTTGTQTLGSNHIMHLWEVWLNSGTYNIRLENLSGTVNWGLSLHEAATVFAGKSDHMAGGTAFLNPEGWNEYFTVTITAAGYHCVSVWKTDSAQLAKSGQYRLSILQPATDVAAIPNAPTITALQAVHPNPFNPRTTVSFDVAQAGMVRVAVYNQRGSLVRTLVSESRSPGHYEVTWDGHDDGGQQVASGIYVARLEAGGVADQRKMVLVK